MSDTGHGLVPGTWAWPFRLGWCRCIDDWLPEFDVVERHDVAVPLGPERALELALGIAGGPGPDRRAH